MAARSSTFDMISRDRIRDFITAVAREFHPERIIFFGSHARGDAGPDSDVDLLMLMRGNGRPTKVAAEIYMKCPSRFPVDLLVRTPEDSSAGYRCATGS
jgi:predicted nucleotidyltransferase